MGASDIHISVDHPPTYRINDRLFSRPEDESLNAQETRKFGEEMIPNRESDRFWRMMGR